MSTWPDVDLGGVRVVVTGANGFIGRRLVAGLTASNAKVTVLLRSGHGRAYFEACGAKPVICKLIAGPKLDEALKGQKILFHFAYDVRASGEDNLTAFSALYDSAQRNQLERIVHASSIVVYDDWPNGQIKEKSAIGSSGGSDYRQSKMAMESALMKGNMPAAILQPTIVYGPGSALWTDAPQSALRHGPVVLPDPAGTCPAVYVDDVVSGALLAAKVPNLGQERFILSGPDHLTWSDFYKAYAKLIGVGTVQPMEADKLKTRFPPPTDTPSKQGPSMLARVSASLRNVIGSRRFDQITSSVRARLSPKGPIFPAPHLLQLYLANPSVSSDTARDRLNYLPQYDLAAGMAAIARDALQKS